MFLKIITILLLATSCGWAKRVTSTVTGSAIETCHKGVTYLQFPSGSTVGVDQDGKPLKCN